jgi:hypothetical protein
LKKKTRNREGAKLEKRLQSLAQRLARTGLILQGTVNRVEIEQSKPGEKPRGPYYHWTWKRNGKTHTVALSEQQAEIFQKAIDNNRKMKQVTAEMRRISLEILNLTTQGVNKRNPGGRD